jgi:chorismate mutase/prephenate dehydratase
VRPSSPTRRRWRSAMLAQHHLPGAERRPVSSNAEGARLASLDPALAGIASERAGSEFGLHVVARRSRTTPTTARALSVVTHPQRTPHPRPAATTAPAWWCRSANRPGAVHDLLVPLKTHGVSMTRFESRPARSGQWEYYFYIDIQGHPDDPPWPPR